MSDEVEFISIEELLSDALVFNDIVEAKEPTVLQFPIETTAEIQTIESIEALNLTAPPDADLPIQRQGFTQAKTIKHAPLALHYAAKNAPLSEIKRLVEEQGYDVNAEDSLSLRPLYVAAQHGNMPAVTYFLEKGADIHDFGYECDTALHVAIEKGNYAIARVMVEQGDAEIDFINLKQKTATNLLIDQYLSILEKGSNTIHKSKSIETMMEIVKTLEVFSKHCGDHFLYSIRVADDVTLDMPISHFLELFASRAPTVEVRDCLLSLATKIDAFDPSGKIYDQAKNLLNAFPNTSNYFLDLGDGQKTLFNGEGHFGCLTTKWARDSINAYYDYLKTHSIDPLKTAVFSKLAQTFDAATELKLNGELESYANKMQERYENGETVLLATGWNSHFIDVVLSKPLGLFITGNSGSRCHEISPGLNYYHMNDPAKIAAKFMHDMTVNLDKTHFERDIMYEYELIEKQSEKVTPLQEFSNCTWVGHQHGIEACLDVELRNLGYNKEQTGALAAKYYSEWEQFHGFYQIDSYMKNSPGLPVTALIDMFMDLTKKAGGNQIGKLLLEAKFCQALSSKHYLADFKEWLTQPQNKAAKKQFEPFLESSKAFDSIYHDGVFNKVTGTVKKLLFSDTPEMKILKSFQVEGAADAHSTTHSAPENKVLSDASHTAIVHNHDPLPHHEQQTVLVS